MKQLQDHERYTAIWNSTLGPVDKAFMLCLNSYGNYEQVYPAIGTLAEKLGCSIRTVKRIKLRLIEQGVLKVLVRYTKYGDRDTDVYTIDFESLSGGGDNLTLGGDKKSPGWCQIDTRVVTKSHPSVQSSVPSTVQKKRNSSSKSKEKNSPPEVEAKGKPATEIPALPEVEALYAQTGRTRPTPVEEETPFMRARRLNKDQPFG